jgi:methionyl-tRNA formyltransferase
MEQLRAWAPDLIVVAAFGQILRKDVLELPRHGCINVHASLLPRWRGAAPINAAILHGDEETGVTIMKMDAGLDTGPMLAKRAIRLTPDDTAGSVFQALSTLGADLLLETLPDYLSGALQPVPQPEEGATYAPMLKKEDGKLISIPTCSNWNGACAPSIRGRARSWILTGRCSKSIARMPPLSQRERGWR